VGSIASIVKAGVLAMCIPGSSIGREGLLLSSPIGLAPFANRAGGVSAKRSGSFAFSAM
jgi:hypothetical protein